MPVLGITILMLAASAGAQEGPMERNSLVYDYFQHAADAVQPTLAWNATSPAEHEAWRRTFEPKFLELLGRNPEAVPIEVVWTGEEKAETALYKPGTRYCAVRGGVLGTHLLLCAEEPPASAPWYACTVIRASCVHWRRHGKERAQSQDQELDYAVKFAEQGCVVAAIVQRGWNETRNEEPHSCHRVTMDSFLLGMTPVGLRTWDAMRVVDFLLTEDLVDPGRIGAAGLSGGGTTTLFLAARDERIKLAMVAGYFCTFRESIFTIHHCICNCVPAHQYGEMSDVRRCSPPADACHQRGQDNIFP